MLLDFQKTQQEFANHIRNGDKKGSPDNIPHERMQVYKDCFFNNIDELLSSCFPILHNIIDAQEWHALIRDYYANHHAQTPLFHEIPQEFLTYLLQEHSNIIDFPFLTELAHYEWMQLMLITAAGKSPEIKKHKDILLEVNLAMSDVAEVVAYHYAVHRIKSDYLPKENEKIDTYLCVYRNSHDEINVTELNALSARLLQILKTAPQSGIKCMSQIAKEMQYSNTQQFIKNNLAILNHLYEQGVIYVQKSNSI